MERITKFTTLVTAPEAGISMPLSWRFWLLMDNGNRSVYQVRMPGFRATVELSARSTLAGTADIRLFAPGLLVEYLIHTDTQKHLPELLDGADTIVSAAPIDFTKSLEMASGWVVLEKLSAGAHDVFRALQKEIRETVELSMLLQPTDPPFVHNNTAAKQHVKVLAPEEDVRR